MPTTSAFTSLPCSFDASGRALPLTPEELAQRATLALHVLDSLEHLGDEEEQRETLAYLTHAVNEDRLSERPDALGCQQWVRGLLAAQVRVVVPAIADYELRRERIRAGKIAGLRRLDAVRMGLEFDPITQAALDRAAELWSVVRTGGQSTAANESLDGDAILAAQALLAVGPGDLVTIATNVGHPSRFVEAAVWTAIQP